MKTKRPSHKEEFRELLVRIARAQDVSAWEYVETMVIYVSERYSLKLDSRIAPPQALYESLREVAKEEPEQLRIIS